MWRAHARGRGKGKQAQKISGEDGKILWGNVVRPPPKLWDVFYQVLEISSLRLFCYRYCLEVIIGPNCVTGGLPLGYQIGIGQSPIL